MKKKDILIVSAFIGCVVGIVQALLINWMVGVILGYNVFCLVVVLLWAVRIMTHE